MDQDVILRPFFIARATPKDTCHRKLVHFLSIRYLTLQMQCERQNGTFSKIGTLGCEGTHE